MVSVIGFAAIDPAIFGNAEDIKAHFSEFLETLRQSPKAEGVERIYTHGEKEILAEKERREMHSGKTIRWWNLQISAIT